MNAFDAVAAAFERDRALPEGVAEAVRWTVLERGGVDPAQPLLDVGCGTGRIGAAFAIAGDRYVGLDLSGEMLRAFRDRASGRPGFASVYRAAQALVRADAGALPFADGSFAAVLMMHVLTAENWRALLAEARRVLRRGGVLVVGKAEAPAGGVDETMRRRLNEILAERGSPGPAGKRDGIGDWLRTHGARRDEAVAATWETMRAPRDFLERKQSAARFGQLPAAVREEALRSLAAWAAGAIGPLDEPRPERHEFRLKLCWFCERGCQG